MSNLFIARTLIAGAWLCMLTGCAPASTTPTADTAKTSRPDRTPMTPDAAAVVTRVHVDKSDRVLTAYSGNAIAARFTGIRFGPNPTGHKQFEGDGRTPEGRYVIDYHNPNSSFTLSLHIDYPNAADRAFAAQHGKSPGGEIFIHGQPTGDTAPTRTHDWTEGCIALSNEEIATLYRIVPDGTPIEIVP